MSCRQFLRQGIFSIRQDAGAPSYPTDPYCLTLLAFVSKLYWEKTINSFSLVVIRAGSKLTDHVEKSEHRGSSSYSCPRQRV